MLTLAKYFLRILIVLIVLVFAFSFVFNRWVQPDAVTPAQDVAPEGEYLTIDGMDYFFIDKGVGPQVFVLLHDFGFSSYTWRYIIEDLSSFARVIAFDLPGFGYSTKGDLDYSMEARVDQLKGVFEALEIEKATILGHGIGARIAMSYATTYQSRIEDLILIAPDLYTKNGWPGFIFSTPEVSRAAYKIFNSDVRLESRYRSMITNPSVLTIQDIDAYKAPYMTEGSETAILTMLKEKYTRYNYENITRPILALYGENDSMVPRVDLERLRVEANSVRVTTKQGVGHLPQEEDPDWIMEQLRAFITDPTRQYLR